MNPKRIANILQYYTCSVYMMYNEVNKIKAVIYDTLQGCLYVTDDANYVVNEILTIDKLLMGIQPKDNIDRFIVYY